MMRSRLLRRFVATTVGTLLLLCQGAALANACTEAAFVTSAFAQIEPCGGSGPEGGTLTHELPAQAACDAQRASIPGANVILLAAAGPVAVTLRPVLELPDTPVQAATDYSLSLAAPPPLTLVHCRLRN